MDEKWTVQRVQRGTPATIMTPTAYMSPGVLYLHERVQTPMGVGTIERFSGKIVFVTLDNEPGNRARIFFYSDLKRLG